jgi:hypothetical protein
MVLGVVVEFESDSFSKLSVSSLSVFSWTSSVFCLLPNSSSESLLNEGELRSDSLLDDDCGDSGLSAGVSPPGYCSFDGGL